MILTMRHVPKEQRLSYLDHTKDPLGNSSLYEKLKERLLAVAVPVEKVDVDISDFECWLKDFSEIREHYEPLGDAYIEKCLEHYLAFRCLKISENDLYIDIGGKGSLWAEILNKKGIRSYRLDIAFPEGIQGINIGANAGNTKLPNGFASVLSAQCSYEWFMGDADILFVKEASRILNEKGRFGILPLYLDDAYFVSTSPYFDQKNVRIESEARRIWRDDGYTTPFSRFYSPESFKKRIWSVLPDDMTCKVLYFRNLSVLMKHYKGQRVYCFFMLYCEKRSKTSDRV